jgi:hypothetical protein
MNDQEVRVMEIVMGNHTPLRCTDCGVMEATSFVAVKRRGLYALLCFLGGKGCYEKSGRALCPAVDNTGIQCMHLQEYEFLSFDGIRLGSSCSEHLALLLPKDPGAVEVHALP